MDLHVAIRTLCSLKYYVESNNYALQLLVRFVWNASELRGESFADDDVRRLGPILSFSAFPFESRTGKLEAMESIKTDQFWKCFVVKNHFLLPNKIFF